MHQSLRGGIVGALIYYYFVDASTICDASMHDSGPCPRLFVFEIRGRGRYGPQVWGGQAIIEGGGLPFTCRCMRAHLHECLCIPWLIRSS